jgi:hypothetical protein
VRPEPTERVAITTKKVKLVHESRQITKKVYHLKAVTLLSVV